MSAKSPWFYCGVCGFKNHPRPAASPTFVPVPDEPGRYELVPGDYKCEQCGAARDQEASRDYSPTGGD